MTAAAAKAFLITVFSLFSEQASPACPAVATIGDSVADL
jgi:hypothetical protein